VIHHNVSIAKCISGLLFSVLITAVITDAIKDGVGRPRPDFFWRCFPNGTGVSVQFYQLPSSPINIIVMRYIMILSSYVLSKHGAAS
jgi:hypothetical protein